MLKAGNSKLKGREFYRITHVYMKDSEPWAKIQKHESQIRSKEYEVKTAELLQVTDKMMTKEYEGLSNKYEHDENPNENYSTIDTDAQNDEMESRKDSHGTPKQPRKAATIARRRIKEIATNSVRRIKEFNRKPPNHAWDYDAFKLMIDEDDEPPRIHR